ncbi:hypothetical protein QCA50_011799 [Cerrena zonata]|uniref:RING-type domain-containing protein n=1 Tax=Cerrena zonata TaxID=2478898 RepID=A0AAW0G0S6_9APHY
MCEPCNRRFANRNSLRNHYVFSDKHHYCAACQKTFATAGGFRVHVEMAAIHRDDSDDEDEEDDDIDDSFDGWEDAVAEVRYPNEGEEDNIPASDDEDYGPGDEYWDEDDETEFEEERDTYWGFASVSAVGGSTLPIEAGPSSARSDTPESSSSASSSSTAYTSGSSSSEASSTSSDNMNGTTSTAVVFGEQRPQPYGCPLCLEAPQQCSATRCGHIFCTACINTALEKKRACPVCREFACTRQLRQIYLPILS